MLKAGDYAPEHGPIRGALTHKNQWRNVLVIEVNEPRSKVRIQGVNEFGGTHTLWVPLSSLDESKFTSKEE